MAVGGLHHLLLGLHEHFEFGEPQTAQIGNVPVWVLRGRWKPEMLIPFFPDQQESIRAGEPPRLDLLPDHVPDTVTVVLGRDEFIPLFPYRIEYGRRVAPASNRKKGPESHTQESVLRPLLTMELFEVQRSIDLDPRLFIYKLGDQHIEDWTERFKGRNTQTPLP